MIYQVECALSFLDREKEENFRGLSQLNLPKRGEKNSLSCKNPFKKINDEDLCPLL